MATRGLVVSDLHLLAKRSRAEELLEEIDERLERCEVLVLNGDTFDFRWSKLRDEEASIAAAIGWLEGLLERFEGREVRYLLGNHDCLRGFCAALEKLAGESSKQLSIHDDWLCLGRHLFLHGDCANRRMSPESMRAFRESWADDRPRGRFSEAMYELVDRSGLCGEFHRRYFPRGITVARVVHYLDAAVPGWRERFDDCYFGHTHLAFRNHEQDGVRFHNTGSGICGMEFLPIDFEYEPEPEKLATMATAG